MKHGSLLRLSFATTLLTLAIVLAAACATAAPRLQSRQGPYSVELLVDGRPARVYAHRGESYLLGQRGRRYTLRVHNNSGQRVEVVATVDGRDVLDGRSGSFAKRGYLLPAWGSLTIEGWRLSHHEIAAFRFSSVRNSYAARTGDALQVGVIGVAFFPERVPPPQVYLPSAAEDSGGLNRAPAPARRPSRQSLSRPGAGRAAAESANSDVFEGKSARSRWRRSEERPGLGTAFGERHYAPVTDVPFERARRAVPDCLLGLRYDDERGLLALGVELRPWRRPYDETQRRRYASPFPAQRGFAAPPAGWDD
ncbi:MAG: hypothetical protein IPL40_04310 [Proteobacteria bacterium]|nr:hypothetical protein [Pseudomonadota bacterium]